MTLDDLDHSEGEGVSAKGGSLTGALGSGLGKMGIEGKVEYGIGTWAAIRSSELSTQCLNRQHHQVRTCVDLGEN